MVYSFPKTWNEVLMYSDKVMDQVKNLCNVGEIEKPDGVGKQEPHSTKPINIHNCYLI
jgi:hypothetical protein